MPSPVGNRALSEAAHPNVQIKSESDKALGKRKASAEPPVAGDSDIDSECMEVDNPYTSGAPSTVTSDTRDDEVCQVVDEDCIITGRSGSLALSDVRPAPRTRPLPSPQRALPLRACRKEGPFTPCPYFHAHRPAMLLASSHTRARTAPRRSGSAAASRPTPSSAATASALCATAPRARARSGKSTRRPRTRHPCGATCARRPRLRPRQPRQRRV